jgi:hypothetical protein
MNANTPQRALPHMSQRAKSHGSRFMGRSLARECDTSVAEMALKDRGTQLGPPDFRAGIERGRLAVAARERDIREVYRRRPGIVCLNRGTFISPGA